ncbi:(2,3-dihydroxybenzoyl)adenylate synthase [Chloroflexota bacterium]
MVLEGFVEPRKEDSDKYISMGWWQNTTLGDSLDNAADLYPDKEAFVDDALRLTFSQLRKRVDRLAAGLLKLGIRKGDPVLIQLPDWNEFICSFFALQKIGAPAVLLLPRHMQMEINHFCGLTRAKAWILPEKYRNTDYLPVIDDVKNANPQIEQVITVRGEGKSGFTSFETLIGDADISERDILEISENRPDPGEVAFILPTGGTTGLPKAVPRTHYSAVSEARYKAEARRQGSNDICLISVPLEHNLGLAAMNGTIITFGKLVFLDSSRPQDICVTVQREKVTRAPLVPTLLARLVNYSGLGNYNMTSLRALYVGGAKTPPDVIRSIHKKLGNVYMGAFGMSEGTGCTTSLDDTEDIILNTIGKPCCPFDEFKVIGEDGRELPINTEGELLTKGPCVFFGYLNNPEENQRAFTPDGYFITGDLAVIDSAGNIRISGRSKDIIIRGGENISPPEMEAQILTHPDVDEVSVIGIPDEDLGERACACVKPRENTTPTLEEIVTYLKSRGVSVLQLPERLEYIDEIPLTNIGKPDKKALSEEIKKRLAGS